MYRVVIVGAGPAGLSAAARARAKDQSDSVDRPSYLLLEAHSAPARTIEMYQKGKAVMAEPQYLDLRSDLAFEAGTREAILGSWNKSLASQSINIRCGVSVQRIDRNERDFTLELSTGEVVCAENVVLAVGTAGNPRTLGVEGEDLAAVQYQLNDPKEYVDEKILVVGAGDSAIENAVSLAEQNDVLILNRRAEFSRAKQGNLSSVLSAINDPQVSLACRYESQVSWVQATPERKSALLVGILTPNGQVEEACDRVIARLGGIPPRAFVEAVGVEFASDDLEALPLLKSTYESTSVAGLYVVGALAGYPLIKQAMNQGYEVIERIYGSPVPAADQPLIQTRFHGLPNAQDVDDVLSLYQKRISLFGQLNALQFRELVIESDVYIAFADEDMFEEAQERSGQLKKELGSSKLRSMATKVLRANDHVYRSGDYADTFFTVAAGKAYLEEESGEVRELERGSFFGEGSLISGQPRRESVRIGSDTVLIASPRRTMLRVLNSNDTVRTVIDGMFVTREVRRQFAPKARFEDVFRIASEIPVIGFGAGETLFAEDDDANCVYLIRSGSVKVTRQDTDGVALLGEFRSGELVGQLAAFKDPKRRQTAVTTVATEAIRIDVDVFKLLNALDGADMDGLRQRVSASLVSTSTLAVQSDNNDVIDFLMVNGLGEATDTLIINDHLCIGCDNCERACADTHGGVSRLRRKAGPTFEHVHVPIACRHCEHPHCMKDCPPNAIHRALDGEVYIDDSCIGCGNCERNCPYGVIEMADVNRPAPSFLRWMLFGEGTAQRSSPGDSGSDGAQKVAVKCDACKDIASGPACVSSCPTGAALRLTPSQFVELLT